MRRFPLLFFPVLLALVGCTSNLASFGLEVDDRTLSLSEEPGRRRAEEGIVPGVFREGRGYELRLDASEEDASLPENRYLEVSYRGNASGAYLEVLLNRQGDEGPLRLPFPAGSAAAGAADATKLVIPLESSRRLAGVRIGREADGSEFALTGLALVEPWRGVAFAEEALTLSAGSSVRRDLELQAWSIDLPPSSLPEAPLLLTYTADSPPFEVFDGTPRTAEVRLSGDSGSERLLRLRLRPGTHQVPLYPWFVGFSPVELRFLSSGTPARLEEVSWAAGAEAVGSRASRPATAEFATVLDFRPETLAEDFTLFRWNLYPDVLLMDFAAYRTQSTYLKRLAFFVEKLGFRGRVSSFAELANRHGWNAHNYSPEGLAAFFTAAGQISPEEEALRLLALEEGIILQEEDKNPESPRPGYVGGSGGIISVSQESHRDLRRLLLTHEAMHGVFYSEPEFVDAVWELWNAQSPEFREAWRFFLASMTYDPADEYLMVNEFQAYLLQQPLEDVEPYLNWRIAPRIRSRDPGRERYSDAFLSRFVRESTEAGRRINEALFRTTGLLGGDVLCLVPAEGA